MLNAPTRRHRRPVALAWRIHGPPAPCSGDRVGLASPFHGGVACTTLAEDTIRFGSRWADQPFGRRLERPNHSAHPFRQLGDPLSDLRAWYLTVAVSVIRIHAWRIHIW